MTLLAEFLASMFAWNVLADPAGFLSQVEGEAPAPLKRRNENALQALTRQAVIADARKANIVKSKELVTESWYFEITVLASVVLSMVVLSYQSPGFPPGPELNLTLRLLEFFVTVRAQ